MSHSTRRPSPDLLVIGIIAVAIVGMFLYAGQSDALVEIVKAIATAYVTRLRLTLIIECHHCDCLVHV